ncbi:GPI-linked NAD(P)(+)--arginine ADP-ribosyltransferase 1 isoform X1 [Mirounga leonina]|uniref:GPI-linked NAD(P)(+)--arginine ADP-ribosyltransferase 1 isoform X1 n=2 Tax=Mirounga leonina TaxID=9715 RepID=UPI00156BF826|nr:GPI-linked NAD(P)(+)--arginine ADP-ribosyltransferase 1 isoform X1 [Mirounga leonina]XP_034850923.1 GPI-linked NAD(P)(+)--arginine ADP-ribosyltransferase 1 isoform X1 [Mirounga leonina]XP_034850924.1 GPI-linked NAD(P)(+)--arginine ADP-ribosyltransferase 1 isoform X1 [Mirounga leonina]XP_034850925.1 GPI-linked NAD(P)(+)--arginine ADP-ribosyltransferase 1 isoform X1 [Mirounga leonina]XP_034850926.1 GPI-linked NAD(P)(+)--arginine ADP-ribosyltransferase 1 isoform X1 [Mirounga leonina]XP_0348509
MQTPAVLSLLLVCTGLMEALPQASLLRLRQAQGHPVTRRDLFSQELPLDMAPASFDDQYAGCAAAMMAALPDLNETEFQANKVYADGWALASSRWQDRQAWGPEWGPRPTRLPPPPPGFRDEHGVALLAYTANSPLHKQFNAAVREAGRSRAHYLHHFSFKTLHFLLTEALQLLGRGQNSPQCRQVFRGVHGLRFRPAGPGATIRLGGFASASLQNVAAQQFGEDTFFGIWTCLGAPIKGYSFFPGEEEVLIPPFETFQVINASRPAQGPARIYLRALGKRSTYNCEYIKDKQCKSRPCRLGNSAIGQGPPSAVWSLLLPLWFLVGGTFP